MPFPLPDRSDQPPFQVRRNYTKLPNGSQDGMQPKVHFPPPAFRNSALMVQIAAAFPSFRPCHGLSERSFTQSNSLLDFRPPPTTPAWRLPTRLKFYPRHLTRRDDLFQLPSDLVYIPSKRRIKSRRCPLIVLSSRAL